MSILNRINLKTVYSNCARIQMYVKMMTYYEQPVKNTVMRYRTVHFHTMTQLPNIVHYSRQILFNILSSLWHLAKQCISAVPDNGR